jgi:hypothetical protein
MQNNKYSRSLIIANNWRKKQIKNITLLQEEMEKNLIDKKLIDKFLIEQYDLINIKYNNKINNNPNLNSKPNLKKNKELVFLMKNEKLLNDLINKKLIPKDYINEQYNKIKVDNINFID